jgi:hypothetical protein
MCFLRRLESSIGMFRGLFGKLASRPVILFSVEFRGFLMRVIWHSSGVGFTMVCLPLSCYPICEHPGLELRLFTC